MGICNNYSKYVFHTNEFAGENYERFKSLHIVDSMLNNGDLLRYSAI